MKVLILDGYTDEPACLGAPPYISPYARLAYGAVADAGEEPVYLTIDQWRSGKVDLDRYDLLAIVSNIAVPGKYLRGMPASDRELVRIVSNFNGRCVASLETNPKNAAPELRGVFDHISAADLDATLFDRSPLRTTGPRGPCRVRASSASTRDAPGRAAGR